MNKATIMRRFDELRADVRALEDALDELEDEEGERAGPCMAEALEAIVDLVPANPYARRGSWEEIARQAVAIAAAALNGQLLKARRA